uniref:F-box and regulator of chromosome condensation repeat protein n=1 Tax=Marseillevirus LCMAC102 TaxID=2506603 RepID=A0A481YVF5_9VIRU|nr:MAG: F-box and regulator of chromosome condensation repeat protein [Marseillevirus LCMAC102]
MTIFYRDIISQIGLYLSLSDLLNTSLTCKKFHSALCNNKTFWKSRYLQDFGGKKEKDIDWKKKYCKNFSCNVWIFGGQHGVNPIRSFTPKRLPNLRAKYVACGAYYTMIIDHKNNVWKFKLNHTPKKLPRVKAKYISCGNYTAIIDKKNNVLLFGWLNKEIVKIPNLKAKSVDCKNDYTIVIDLKDKVWRIEPGCINDRLAADFVKTKNIPIVTIDQEDQRLLLDRCQDLAVNDIYCIQWFSDHPNSLYNIPCLIVIEDCEFSLYHGHDTTDDSKHISVAYRYNQTIVINKKNDLWRYSTDLSNADRCVAPPIQIHDLKAKSIACGGMHTIIVDHEGNAFAYGDNDYGQLGLGEFWHAKNHPLGLNYSNFSERKKIPGLKAEMVACGDCYTVIIGHKVKNDNLILHV